MENFVHLHLHSEYSLLDGACRISELVLRIKELGQSAVAVTDHGVMCGLAEFYKACKKEGIHPVLGCECYVAPRNRTDRVFGVDNKPYHLVLLAENQIGYENLMAISSEGFLTGFYAKPRVDKEFLRQHSEGLIALSACLAGELPRLLVQGQYDAAKQAALEYAELFGKEHFYIELQNHGIQEQKAILPDLLRLCRETGLSPVVTNDVHYLRKENAEAQHVSMCIQTGHTLHEEGGMEFSSDEFYVKSEQEMRDAFASFADPLVEEGIQNTAKIAARCQVDYTFGELKLPKFVPPAGETCDGLFDRLCEEGLAKRYGEAVSEVITKRLQDEKHIIRSMGFQDYYLIVWDFIRFAKEKGIPVGPGRGSGAGSLVAYLMGITDVDPMRYGLLFERFLNPERVTMPDFDIDFCYEGRQQVIAYVIEKYGADRVCQIITFGTMAAKGAIRDVGRVMGLPYALPDRIARMVPTELNMTIDRALEVNSRLAEEYQNDRQVRTLIDTAKTLEGMPRNASTHAAGVVITPESVVHYLPLQKNDDAVVTQFVKETVEELGLLKIDFLGLRTLTVIDWAVKTAKRQNPAFQAELNKTDDEAVYAMLAKGRTTGVFQLESSGMRQLLIQMKPRCVEDLIAAISLYRPGPMKNIPLYIENRKDPEHIAYLHPALEPILRETYGVIIYQEQVMQICRDLAGYSYGRSDLVRRAMAKKKADVMEAERNTFIYGCPEKDGKAAVPGCVKNGISAEIAEKIFDEMTSFAAYAFNKSHAAGYALLAYRTAWLKYHQPEAFFAAMLSVYLGDAGKLVEINAECRKLGIRLLPPSVNESDIGFSSTGSGIRFGLLAIKNIGRNLLDSMIRERRENGPFTSFPSFCERMSATDLNARGLESLISAGALDGLGWNRCQMMTRGEQILADYAGQSRNRLQGQMSLFDTVEEAEEEPPYLREYDLGRLLQMEKDVMGLYLSGHPLSEFQSAAEAICPDSILTLREKEDHTEALIFGMIAEVKVKTAKSGHKMAILQVEDFDSQMEVVVFGRLLEQYQPFFEVGKPIICRGKLSVREEEEPSLVAEAFYRADEKGVAACLRDGVGKKSAEEVKSPTDSKTVGRLCIKLAKQADFERLLPLLQAEKGPIPVLLYLEETKAYRQAPESLSVSVAGNLLSVLEQAGFVAVYQPSSQKHQ